MRNAGRGAFRSDAAGVWSVIALLIISSGIGAYIALFGPPLASTTTIVDGGDVPLPPAPTVGSEFSQVNLPSLDETDGLVRELVKRVSSHSRMAEWLAVDGLIRNFTVGVTKIAQGKTPTAQLIGLRPLSRFRVVKWGRDLYIDSRGYERYDELAAVATSIDPIGSRHLYVALKPRIDEAHRELDSSDMPFEHILERAIVVLLDTPVLVGPVRVEVDGNAYRFATSDLEALLPAQKQFLSIGPRNVRAVQSSLREFALALGIAGDRLPAPHH